MWQQYRKTFFFTQAFIALICAGAVVFGKVPTMPLLFLFIMLQGFSLVGAAWATRLKRKITQRMDQLPLASRRA